jgi:hypothetical protein
MIQYLKLISHVFIGGNHHSQGTVKFMLNRMKLVIIRLTYQRKRCTTNHYGQLKSGMMVNDYFDPELRKFLSDLLRILPLELHRNRRNFYATE